jgi:zinc transport system substrate-binding protein
VFSASLETVFVSVLPQKYFMQQICKSSINIEVMVAPGASPHSYEPKPSQMKKLAVSRAYFAIGMPFEVAWLDKFIGVNPQLKIVNTDAGIEKIAMVEHHDEEEHHQPVAPHEQEPGRDGLDPHIWLSPLLVKKQAVIMKEALAEFFPDKAAFFQENLVAFTKEIDALDADLRSLLKGKEGMRFMVFHPSWGYFAKDYGLEQVAVEIEGKEPKPNQMGKLIQQAKAQNIHVIFAQPQFSTKSAKLLAGEISGEVVLIDPLAENWFQNMRQVAEKLRLTVK